MRSGPNTRRLRGRNTGRRNQPVRSQNFESNGPEVKVRGNAQQVVEKYLQLARDASTAGDPIMAENYFQHAEHYHRILHANGDGRQGGRGPNGAEARNGGNGEDGGRGGQPEVARPAAESGDEADVAIGKDAPDETGGPIQEAG